MSRRFCRSGNYIQPTLLLRLSNMIRKMRQPQPSFVYLCVLGGCGLKLKL
jgi:hypothetical protein